MKDVSLWKIGFVRILAICIIGIGIKGILFNLTRHTMWSFAGFSGPSAIGATVVGLAIFILGFRTERDHAEISRINNP